MRTSSRRATWLLFHDTDPSEPTSWTVGRLRLRSGWFLAGGRSLEVVCMHACIHRYVRTYVHQSSIVSVSRSLPSHVGRTRGVFSKKGASRMRRSSSFLLTHFLSSSPRRHRGRHPPKPKQWGRCIYPTLCRQVASTSQFGPPPRDRVSVSCISGSPVKLGFGP